MGKNASELKKVRFKTLAYELDTNDRAMSPKITFTGNWSQRDLDRLLPQLRRALNRHKADLIRKDKGDDRAKARPEWPYTN